MHEINNETMILGKKIKFFRERAKMNQMQLELAIGASSGQISRIEKGAVNPTKETILNIIKVLNLNHYAAEYLIGAKSNPVCEKEIDQSRKEVYEYFQRKNVFAYLICDRQRIWLLSQGFIKLFSPYVTNPQQLQEDIIGNSIIQIMLDDKFQIARYLGEDNITNMIKYNLIRFYRELSFMIDDENIQETMKLIKMHSIASKIWNEIKTRSVDISLNSLDSRVVNFNIKGFDIKLNYGREFLDTNTRFEIIEYIPTNKLVRFITKL